MIGPKYTEIELIELERKAKFYSLSQGLLDDMAAASNPLEFLGTLILKMNEIIGGDTVIGVNRMRGNWFRLVLDAKTKTAEWNSFDQSYSSLYDIAASLDYIAYSKAVPEINVFPDEAKEIIHKINVDSILIIPVQFVDDIVVECTDFFDPMSIPQYVNDIRYFLVPLTLIIKQVILLDENIREKEKASLVTKVLVHDIRNIIATIEASLYLIENSPAIDITAREALSIAKQSIKDASVLISKISDSFFSEGILESKPMNLIDTISNSFSIIKSNRIDIPLDIKIADDCSPRNPWVVADDLLTEVIINLVNNSIDYTTGETKWVRINWNLWELDKSKIHIRIVDSGVGISDDIIKHISRNLRIKSETGLGLGLSIVSSLIQKYKGVFWFERREEIEGAIGTIANILLPICEF